MARTAFDPKFRDRLALRGEASVALGLVLTKTHMSCSGLAKYGEWNANGSSEVPCMRRGGRNPNSARPERRVTL